MLLNPLNNLGKVSARIDEMIKESVRINVACYGSREITNMSAAMYDIWTSKMAKRVEDCNTAEDIASNNRHIGDQVHRAHFQVAIWRSALQ